MIAPLTSFYHTNRLLSRGAVNTSPMVPARFSRHETSAMSTAAAVNAMGIVARGRNASTTVAIRMNGMEVIVIRASVRDAANAG